MIRGELTLEISEFLVHLQQAPFKWYVASTGVLRTQLEGFCPLTAVCKDLKGCNSFEVTDYQRAAELLGLSQESAQAILVVSDTEEGRLGPALVELRQQLLWAVEEKLVRRNRFDKSSKLPAA